MYSFGDHIITSLTVLIVGIDDSSSTYKRREVVRSGLTWSTPNLPNQKKKKILSKYCRF